MSGVESAALRLGSVVVSRLASTWLADRRAQQRRGQDLTSLLAKQFPLIRHQRAMRRELEKIEEEVARHLEPLMAHEFRALDENEQCAALNAVTDLLAAADISDNILFAVDLDYQALAREVSRQNAKLGRTVGLSSDGLALFSLALDQSCWWLVSLVRELPEFSSATAIEFLRRSTDMMAMLDDIRVRLPLTTVDAPRGSTHDEEFRRRYYSYLIGTKGFIELLGVNTRNYQHRLPLDVAYLSLCASQEDPSPDEAEAHPSNPTWGARWYVPPSGGSPWSDFQSLRVESTLSRSPRILLRGEAGSGKSTLLDWLTVTAAKGEFPEVLDAWNGLVPFPIRLRSYAGARLPQPEQFLAHTASWLAGLEPEAWTYRQLKDGRCLLLVDGVDELPAAQRAGVRRWLQGLVTTWPTAKVVVTSRPAAAAAGWLEDFGFKSVALERMKASDVRRFIRNWHASAAQSDSPPCDLPVLFKYENQLLGGLESRSDLQALATNPLLCAMLCAVNADRGGNLPNDRMAVYKAALEMLLERRDADRDMAVPLTGQMSSILLQDLAWRLTLNNRSEISKTDATVCISRKIVGMPKMNGEAEDLLQHLIDRSGVIREPVEGRIDFVHRSFQEYLAAAEVAAEDHIGALVERAHLDSWRETIIMTCAHANRPQRAELIEGLLGRARNERRNGRKLKFLAVSCLESLADLHPALLDAIADAMKSFVPPKTRSDARALGNLGPSVLGYLPDDTRPLPPVSAAATVRAVGLTGTELAIPLLAAYASDSRTEVQAELAKMWPYFGAEMYAEKVLRTAPLLGGKIEVEDPALLTHLSKLEYMRSVEVSVLDDPIIALDVFEMVPFLTSLQVNAVGSIDLSPLTGHSNLRALGVAGPAQLRNLEVLHALAGLRNLTLFNLQRWRDIQFLTDLPNLRSLTLAALQDVRDFSPLEFLTKLTDLQLHDSSGLVDLSCISHLGQCLERLTLTGANSDRLPSSFAQSFTRVSRLFLVGFSEISISILAGMPLKSLWLQSCPKVDLGGLSAVPELERLTIDHASELLNLASLTDLVRLREVTIRGNGPPIDLSRLQGMKLIMNIDAGRVVVGLQPGGRLKVRHVG